MVAHSMSPEKQNAPATGEKVITTVCNSHCGGACALRVHVRQGVVIRIETDAGEDPQLRACLRGRAYRQRVNAPDRLKYPLQRVGERGRGQFERVSWDQALETIAGQMRRIRDTYGPDAIVLKSSAGDSTFLHGSLPFSKVLSLLGGFSLHWGYNSFEQGIFAELATYGTLHDRNSRDDLLNARLIVLWACNPATTIHDTNTGWYLARAREQGTKIVCVDPRYTDTAAALAHQWIPIIPGTDCAMMIAMAYVMVKENLQDQKFLDTYTLGFKQFEDYVTGAEDGIPKTPAWAEGITGVPAAAIEGLAREYAGLKPGALIAGIAAGRTAFGEQYHRVAMTLAAMTGNIGIPGGNAAGRSWTASGMYPFFKKGGFLKGISNPVLKNRPAFNNFLPARLKYGRGNGTFCSAKLGDAILNGTSGGYPADYKMLWIVNCNYPNQNPDINKALKGLKKLECIVTVEQFMTPAARWADIVLPSSTFFERNDLTLGEGNPFVGFQNQVIDPIGESKSHLQMALELAKKLELSEFEGLTEDGILREMVKGTGIPDYDAFKREAVHRIPLAKPYVAFKNEIEQPLEHPFPTPSGKIEIYSRQLAEMNDPHMPPVPKYIEAWESRRDPLAAKYPLQLITTHFKRRAHTQFETLPWLRELEEQRVQISQTDARQRGISDGDLVEVFNDRGAILLPAAVTQRIMAGVAAIPEGAWHDPDENGVDRGGNPNVLLKDEISPGGGFITNTCLVEVQKA